MPETVTLRRAREAKREGKSPSTQAGEFIREEIHHIREGKHGARSARQAIAIGLSKARRAGVKLPIPRKGKVSEEVRRRARHDNEQGRENAGPHEHSSRRSRATFQALKREGHAAASHTALSRQARESARHRSAAQRSAIARKAARTRAAEMGG